MTERLFFVVNPVSGNGKAKKLWPLIQQELIKSNIKFDFEETQSRGDGIRIAKAARIKNYKCYIAVGGDGTFHEMINGLLFENNAPPTVFILPIGTGNDFVRTHSIPKWGEEWMNILIRFQSKKHNAGLLTYQENELFKTRYFVNVAGLFYDAYIVHAATFRKKPISSSFQYLGLVMTHLFKYKPPKAIIKWDEKKIEGKYYTANIGVAKYSGGGMQIVPHADPFGSNFAITIARSMHPIRVLFSTPYFYNEKVEKHRKITCFETKSIDINPIGEPILVEADGEFLGQAPFHAELIEGAFRLVCNKDIPL